ncbi:hypothetical protein V2O64_23100 [Verrucomicrobiaceae bacterium 227]
MSDTVEFSCPNCHTQLRVPIEMAGVTGPCPHCEASISSPPAPKPANPPAEEPKLDPKPTPKPAAQPTPKQTPKQPPVTLSQSDHSNHAEFKKERSLGTLVLILALSAAAVYGVIHLMGTTGPEPTPSETEAVSSEEEATAPPSPIAPKPAKPEETPELSPPIIVPPSPVSPSTPPGLPEPETPVLEEPAVIPEDINKPGEIPTDLPEIGS